MISLSAYSWRRKMLCALKVSLPGLFYGTKKRPEEKHFWNPKIVIFGFIIMIAMSAYNRHTYTESFPTQPTHNVCRTFSEGSSKVRIVSIFWERSGKVLLKEYVIYMSNIVPDKNMEGPGIYKIKDGQHEDSLVVIKE